MKKMLAAAILLPLAIGCGNEAAEKMGGGPPPAEWSERNALDPIIMGAALAGEMGNWKGAQKELDAAALTAALDALAASTPPDGVDKAKVDSAVSSGKAFAEAASGSAKDFEAAYTAFTNALKGLNPAAP